MEVCGASHANTGLVCPKCFISAFDTRHANPNRKAALKVTFEPGGKIYNIGYFGVPVKEGDQYRLYFFAESDTDVVITAALESEEGTDLGNCELSVHKDSDYQRYDCELTGGGTDFKGRISLTCDRACTITLGFISLMPAKTFKGHGLREDLAMALKNTNAKFIRFPGGCVVEGINEQNALRFSRTIGPVWERPRRAADVALPHDQRAWFP